MDPKIVLFGFGVGFLVGMTGMGGGSLMTPLLVLLFGDQADHRDRHRHLLCGHHQDRRQLATPEAEDGEHAARLLDGDRQRPDRRSLGVWFLDYLKRQAR